MDVAEYDIIVIQGAKRHLFRVNAETTVGRLSEQIESMLNIPQVGQRIINKGSTLGKMEDTLVALGIGPGSRLMVLGRVYKPENDELYQKVIDVETSCLKVAERLNSIKSDLSADPKGDPDHPKHHQELLQLNEELMRMLEYLDGLRFQNYQSIAKGKRKKVVQNIQLLMDHVDQVQERIKES